MINERISEKLPYPSKFIEVYGSKMHFVEAGSGQPILFLHGIPTSCYLWRNIIPHLVPLGRCIALDLIGFGQSDQPNIDYSVSDHIKYVEKFIETLGLSRVVLIMHGFGSIIGFDYAMQHEKNCRGLVFYEAFLRSLNGNDISLPFQEQIATFQDDSHLDLMANGTTYVDTFLPQMIMRSLSDEEMHYYRKPFLNQTKHKALLKYLHELASNQGEALLDQLIHQYSEFLTQSKLPKLLLYSIPGFITTIATIMWAKENFPNLETIDIGEELHFAQESCPNLIGESISVWLQGVEQK